MVTIEFDWTHMAENKRTPTRTYTFGSGKRESHDSSHFYSRFVPPKTDQNQDVCPSDMRSGYDKIHCADIREQKHQIPANSVALVVTSPPYFAGKEYEIDKPSNPSTTDYEQYLKMLTEVFAVCVEALEPGGRMAVNVANLGRKPYRSLSSDVISILQNDLSLLLRGEIIWQKSKGAAGNCAWGSFRKASNPVLRDITERIVVASKNRFDRALSTKERSQCGLPYLSTIGRDEFMESTLDIWEFPPEKAKAVGHPAPFPIELPKRLIELYTYEGDIVLDPFMGSGSTAVAAVRTKRHFIGFDTDPNYVEAAKKRLAAELGAAQEGSI